MIMFFVGWLCVLTLFVVIAEFKTSQQTKLWKLSVTTSNLVLDQGRLYVTLTPGLEPGRAALDFPSGRTSHMHQPPVGEVFPLTHIMVHLTISDFRSTCLLSAENNITYKTNSCLFEYQTACLVNVFEHQTVF